MQKKVRVLANTLGKISVSLFCLLTLPGIGFCQSVVDYNGLLKVSFNKIVNQHNEVVSFAGNSFFWSNDNWGGEKYYNASVVSWLKRDWRATIVRAAMGVEDTGGYINNPERNKTKLKAVVDAAIVEGLYVIIDWHSHHAENYTAQATAFFKEMAERYGEYNNVIYEVYNEPLQVSWSNTVKPYAETIISSIRDIDPDNLIIVGSPEWSQRVDLVAADPITGYDNIAYSLHFYTVWHQQWLRDRATEALNKGISLFVTEWGSIGYTGTDPETDKWMDWCLKNDISHCNWAVNDKDEEWSIIRPGSSTTGVSRGEEPESNRTGSRALRVEHGIRDQPYLLSFPPYAPQAPLVNWGSRRLRFFGAKTDFPRPLGPPLLSRGS